MRLVHVAVLITLSFVGAHGCTKPNPAFCRSNEDCEDPSAPVCDIDGTIGGTRNECVAPPGDGGTRSRELTVSIAGNGGGSVLSNPAGIECPSSCTASFADGEEVTLVAASSETSLFEGWSGDCSGQSTSCSLSLDSDRNASATFRRIRVLKIAAGAHTCALLETGSVRCWGHNAYGQLGYGHTLFIGDDELPYEAGDVDLGGKAIQLCAGTTHTCAVLEGGQVRCWGRNDYGQLGYGNTEDVGDDELPSSVSPVNLGGGAADVACGQLHTCARLDNGAVRCWGYNVKGQLGYGDTEAIGDDESPAFAGDLDIGVAVSELSVGGEHACVRTSDGVVRCWGDGTSAQLGYPGLGTVGDNETPASAGNVDVGGSVLALAAGGAHSCALMNGGMVRCWGSASSGQLGLGTTENVGDDETPSSAPELSLGGTAVSIAAGFAHTCAVIASGQRVRCWGNNGNGRLGLGHTMTIGDDELPDTQPSLEFGLKVEQLALGSAHSCALLETGEVRCWGNGVTGSLGYGNTENIGDDELGSTATDVPVLAPEP